MSDIWNERPAVYYDNEERFGTATEMIAEIRMLRTELAELRKLTGGFRPKVICEPENGWRQIDSFSEAEKKKLRPIAETIAMLDGNAFFTLEGSDGRAWYEAYLPEASSLYESNGGDDGWAGEASFAKTSKAMSNHE